MLRYHLVVGQENSFIELLEFLHFLIKFKINEVCAVFKTLDQLHLSLLEQFLDINKELGHERADDLIFKLF